jgi:RNA polymerase sigma-70 factor (ECF subfamily)
MESEPTDSEQADEALLARLRADPAAFEAFYRRHVDRVIGFAARRVSEPADVADLVAATFVTVLTSAGSYDRQRGDPGAWLLGITARLIANARRRRVRESAAIARVAGRRLIGQSDIERLEERIDAARTSQAVVAALARLRPRAREALLLVGAEGLSPAQAAQVLGVSPAAFRMRLTSARRALDKAVAAQAPDEAGPAPGSPGQSPDGVTPAPVPVTSPRSSHLKEAVQ